MDTKHLREYVALYHDELHKMHDEIKTYCLIKGYIELELQEDWDTIAYDLTELGRAWLYHTPDSQPADSGATGEYQLVRHTRITNGQEYWLLLSPSGDEVDSCTVDSPFESELRHALEHLNTETATLRAETARLQRELDAARERIAELEDQLRQCNDAYYHHT